VARIEFYVGNNRDMSEKSLGNLLVVGQFALLGVLLLLQGARDWSLPAVLDAVAKFLLAAGLAIAIIAIFNLGKSLTANPVPLDSATLKTGGLYAVVRHPIYLGFILAGIGLTATSGSWLAMVALAGLSVLLSFKARFEESMLLRKFDGYRAYATKVGRLLPGIGKLKP